MSLPSIFNGDTTVTNDRARADVFNKYFYSVFTDEDCSDLSSLRTASKLSSIVKSITFTTQDVYQELLQLNLNKACGPDLLTLQILKRNADFICESLCNFFKSKHVNGFTSQRLDYSKCCTCSQKGDRRVAASYRPISLTSIVVKIMERIICRKLTVSQLCSSVHCV